jgi:hypothetical protein
MSHDSARATTENGMIFCERSRASVEQMVESRKRAARSSAKPHARRDRMPLTSAITDSCT